MKKYFFVFNIIPIICCLASIQTQKSDYFKQVSLNSVDYINNGLFSDNICTNASGWCIWTKPAYNSSYISNWEITDEIQMGIGNLYNPKLNTNKIVQLDSLNAKCIYQNVQSIPTGIFNLTYSYTSRINIPLDWATLLVYVDSFQAEEIIQYDYQIHTKTTQITNLLNGSIIQVKFCAKGPQIWDQGVILVNVSLIKVSQLQNSSINNSLINNTQIKNQVFSNQLFNDILKAILKSQYLQVMNKIPANRIIFNQFLAFFINLDHLWLYNYHLTNYSNPMKNLLEAINNLQNQKWEFFKGQLILNQIGINSTQIKQNIDFKNKYSSVSFVDIENTGSTFFPNSTHFFLINIWFVILTFIIGKILYKMLAKYKLSVLIKQFSFNLNIVLILLEGNIQSFSYYFTSDCLKIFSFNPVVKISNILTLCFYFNFLFLTIAGYFLLLAFYPKKSQHIYNNCKVNKRSCVCLFVSYGLVNLALGMIHIILQNDNDLQLLVIGIVEIFYCFIMMIQISNKKQIFEHKYLVWINIWASFIRFLLTLTHKWFNIYIIESVLIFTQAQQILILVYLGLMVISILISIIILIITIKKIIKFKEKKTDQINKSYKLSQVLSKSRHKVNKKRNQKYEAQNKYIQQKYGSLGRKKPHLLRFKKQKKELVQYSKDGINKLKNKAKQLQTKQKNQKLFQPKQNSLICMFSLNQQNRFVDSYNSANIKKGNVQAIKIEYNDSRQQEENQNNQIEQVSIQQIISNNYKWPNKQGHKIN